MIKQKQQKRIEIKKKNEANKLIKCNWEAYHKRESSNEFPSDLKLNFVKFLVLVLLFSMLTYV